MLPPRVGVALVGTLLGLFLSGCQGEIRPEQRILDFTRAVQDRDAATLYCLSAGAAGAESLGADENERQAGFERWFESELLSYEEGRDLGEIELSGHGVRLVKLFSLGRGAYYREVARSALSEGGVRLRMRHEFGYSQIDLSALSPGTTFYLAAAPPGRVLPVVIPAAAREIRVEPLDSIEVDWTLVRTPALDGCPAGFKVATVEPVDNSWNSRSITWVF